MNLSCPGEVYDGLIGKNPALGGGREKNGESDSAPCGRTTKTGFPRHFEYGPVSQLEAAIGINDRRRSPSERPASRRSKSARTTSSQSSEHAPPRLPGSPRLPRAVRSNACCTKSAKTATTTKKAASSHIITNLGTAIGVLRNSRLHRPGGRPRVLQPAGVILPGSDTLQKKLNDALEAAIDGKKIR